MSRTIEGDVVRHKGIGGKPLDHGVPDIRGNELVTPMVSTIRFRSVKAIDVGWRRSYFALFLGAVALALVASHPRLALVVLSYTYTATALVVWGYTRLRRRPAEHPADDGRIPESSEHPF